jgi:hypothetical protein
VLLWGCAGQLTHRLGSCRQPGHWGPSTSRHTPWCWCWCWCGCWGGCGDSRYWDRGRGGSRDLQEPPGQAGTAAAGCGGEGLWDKAGCGQVMGTCAGGCLCVWEGGNAAAAATTGWGGRSQSPNVDTTLAPLTAPFRTCKASIKLHKARKLGSQLLLMPGLLARQGAASSSPALCGQLMMMMRPFACCAQAKQVTFRPITA